MERKKALKIGAVAGTGVFVGLVILGNIIGPEDDTPAVKSAEAAASPTPTATTTTPASGPTLPPTTAPPTPEPTTTPPAPATVGLPLPEARTTLEAAGYTVTATDSLEDRGIWAEENWVVTTQEISGTGARLGAQKSTDGDEGAAPSTGNIVTPSGLGFGAASVACDNRAEVEYVYGWDASWIWNGTHIVEDDTMFLKAGVQIENAYGNEYEATVECRVSGTNDAPVVDSFLVY